MSELMTRMVRGREVAVGDTITFLGRGYRITGFDPYEGPLGDIIDRIACVEGHGQFMLISPTTRYGVLA